MSNKMLIDATHPEETRVVVLRGNRVEEFDFESANRKQLRGNIYLAKVTRVEPSLQAAFVDYGGNRHGFLAFSEIHPDYYQIPVADRQALLDEESRSHRDDEEDSESERRPRRGGRHRRRGADRNRSRDVVRSDATTTNSDGNADASGSETAGDNPNREDFSRDATENPAGDTPSDNNVALSGGDNNEAPHHTPREAAHADDHASHDIRSELHDTAPQAVATEQPDVGAAEPQPALSESAPHDPAAAPSDDQHDHQSHDDQGHDHKSHGSDDEHHDDDAHEDDANGEEHEEEEIVESVGGDALEEVPDRAPRYKRHYKIQEVIKRRQVLLVQVVKEERGTKGAALTTYLSLAGRYSVLMPNTARGGGISRKVTNSEDRKKMKEVAEELEVPEGMGVILRTAGAARTKLEIKRDFEYLLRLWENVRDLTLKSSAPTLVYEEGSLVKRSIRDLYHKEIDEIIVEGESAYREAKDFMRMLMPSHVKNVVLYNDSQPVFARYGMESQLDAMFQPTVQLKSGGYIVINQTEALVAIDVNSGRATREHSIEDTATKTNSEAAVEVARQLRLRDLAGLIVIDFIDMDEGRNNRSVERKLKEALKSDRARIQVGRISHFGLMEMSRQRIRTSVLESSTETCPHCGGTGHVRSVSSVALQLLRSLEEQLIKGATHNLIVRARSEVAIYVLNHKRAHLRMMEERFKIAIAIMVDPTLSGHPAFAIDRGEQVMTLEEAKAILAAKPAPVPSYAGEDDDEIPEDDSEIEAETDEEEPVAAQAGDEQPSAEQAERSRRRRRGRRGRGGRGRDGEGFEPAAQSANGGGDLVQDRENTAQDHDAPARDNDDEAADADGESNGSAAEAGGENGDDKRRRRRGRRGGRRNRRTRDGEDAPEGSSDSNGAAIAQGEDAGQERGGYERDGADDIRTPSHDAPSYAAHAPRAPAPAPAVQPTFTAPPAVAAVESEAPRRRSTIREPAPAVFNLDTEHPASPPPSAPAPSIAPQPEAAEADKPRRFGWWSSKKD